MVFDLLGPTLDFIAQYGLIAIFILLVLDGAMLMPVLPGEIIMIMAVTAYADTYGDLVFLVALATAAAVVGSLLLYGIARGGGRRLIENHPRLFMMSRRRRERLERAFEHPAGQSLVLFLRVIPLTRVLVNIPAGLARMKLGRFVVLSTIGMVIFHAGFMWLAFEFRQPDSGVAQTAASVNEEYASPAWNYILANEVVTVLAALALGAILSFRASRRRYHDSEETTGSLIGWLSSMILLWGGVAVAVALWLDPRMVLRIAAAGGLDLHEVSVGLPNEPHSIVALAAGFASVLGLILTSLRRSAKRRHKAGDEERDPWAEEPEEPTIQLVVKPESKEHDWDDERAGRRDDASRDPWQ